MRFLNTYHLSIRIGRQMAAGITKKSGERS
jgi:hypothetical protein